MYGVTVFVGTKSWYVGTKSSLYNPPPITRVLVDFTNAAAAGLGKMMQTTHKSSAAAHYRIDAFNGEGVYARAVSAVDRRSGKRVAIKIARGPKGGVRDLVAIEEAKFLRIIQEHESVLTIKDDSLSPRERGALFSNCLPPTCTSTFTAA
jgi:hypothetical protein